MSTDLALFVDYVFAPLISVALAWVLARSPNILPIPGAGSLDQLEENIAASTLKLSAEDIAELG